MKPLPDTPEVRKAHSALMDVLLPALGRHVNAKEFSERFAAAQNELCWMVVDAARRAVPSAESETNG